MMITRCSGTGSWYTTRCMPGAERGKPKPTAGRRRPRPMDQSMPDGTTPFTPDESGHRVTFRDALRFWFKLGWISFGGPAGQIAIMQTELVDRKRWIGQRLFLTALNFCTLLPGPEATQLAIYIGWRLHGLWGGVAAGTLFVLPGAFVLL